MDGMDVDGQRSLAATPKGLRRDTEANGLGTYRRSPAFTRKFVRSFSEREAHRQLIDLGSVPLPALKHRDSLPPEGGTPATALPGRDSVCGTALRLLVEPSAKPERQAEA
jgi:hypothetical protein